VKRPVYILAGFSGMITAALLLAWQVFGRTATAPGGNTSDLQNVAFQSIAVIATAIFLGSAWFLWTVIRPRR
jgi:hypothetical protein